MRRLIPYHLTALMAILLLNGGQAEAQLNILSVVKRLPARHYYNVEGGQKSKGGVFQRRTNDPWVAFSDSDENIAFADPYGRKRKGRLQFMQALYVLRERNGYCKVMAYDPKVLAKRGLISNILSSGAGPRRVADLKKAVFLGWVKESQLLHSPHGQVDASNLQPLKYLAAISHPKMIVQREEYLDKDSVLLRHSPGFRKEVLGKIPLGEWVYVYKKLAKPAQHLIGTEPVLNPDSLVGTFGWVADSMILPSPQNMVLLPPLGQRKHGDEEKRHTPVYWLHDRLASMREDSLGIPMEEHPFQPGGSWMLPVRAVVDTQLDTARQVLRTYIPMELIDIKDSKVYNCLGQPFSYQEYQSLQRQLRTINLIVVFEDGKEGKEAIRNMITSFQELSEQTQSEDLADYTINYAAVGYMGRWPSDTLGWTTSFSQWLDFIQAKAEDQSVELEILEHVMLRGMQEAAGFLRGKEREHNLVVVIGSKINPETFPKLFDHVVPQLAAVSANLLFLQSNVGKAQNYSDFVMQAKRMLEEVGREERPFRQQIIVDNNLVTLRNELVEINRCGNGYLYDFPAKSMQKGGIFFPNANQGLCPDLLEWAIDTLLTQVRVDNDLLMRGMRSKFSILNHLEHRANPELKESLENQGILGLPDYLTNSYDDRIFVEVAVSHDPVGKDFTSCFLVRKDAFAEFGEALRHIVIDPKVDRNGDSEIDFRDRRMWYRELRRSFRERKKYFNFRGSLNGTTLAKVIFMETGFPVNNEYFLQLPLGSIKRKAEQEELLPAIQRFYRDIVAMESYPSEHPSAMMQAGSHQYFILPLKSLP